MGRCWSTWTATCSDSSPAKSVCAQPVDRPMILLVDIGNTRFKWARFDGQALEAQAAQPHAQWTREHVIESLIRPTPRPDRVLVSNVGGQQVADLLRSALRDEWNLVPEF